MNYEINREQAATLRDMALVQFDQEEYLEAISLLQQALQIINHVPEEAMLLKDLLFRDEVYEVLGVSYYRKGDFQSAITVFEEDLKITLFIRDIKDIVGKGNSDRGNLFHEGCLCYHIALCNYELGNVSEAKRYNDRAEKYYDTYASIALNEMNETDTSYFQRDWASVKEFQKSLNALLAESMNMKNEAASVVSVHAAMFAGSVAENGEGIPTKRYDSRGGR